MSERTPPTSALPTAPASSSSGSDPHLQDAASPAIRVEVLRLELEAAKLEWEIAAVRRGASPETQLQNRVARLRLELEAAKLEHDIADVAQDPPADLKDAMHAVRVAKLTREAADLKPVPQSHWWHRWGSVAGVTALVTATVPITTGVLSYFSNQRTVDMERTKNQYDLALKDQQQKHQIESDRIRQSDEIGRVYLSLTQDPKERARVLRFAKNTAPIQEIRSWAAEELTIVQVEIDQLKKELEDAKIKALPHRCLKWQFERVNGNVPAFLGPSACAARAGKQMAKKGEVTGEFFVKSKDGVWVRALSPSSHVIDCKCMDSRPEEPSSQKPTPQ